MFRSARLLAATIVLLQLTPIHAEDAKPVDGALSISGRPYKLQYAVAYETRLFGDSAVAIVASGQPISSDAVKKALIDTKDQPDVWLRQPHVKVVFDKSGKLSSYYVSASGFAANAGSDKLVGEVKRDGDRLTGAAKLPSQDEGQLQRSFDFQFSLGLFGSSSAPVPQTAPLARPGVAGTFKGNGKDARLAFVTARSGEPFDDKPSIKLIFTERDHSREPRPESRAAFGNFGSALMISCFEDGTIFGCEVAHSAHARKPFSSSGQIEMAEFQIAGGQVQGKLTTGGEAKFFEQTWEVDLTFAAPFTAPVRPQEKKSSDNAVASAPQKKQASGNRPPESDRANAPDRKPVARMSIKDLAILQGVDGVEYKKVVEHASFQSPTNYKALAAELAKKLDAQGWTKDGNDLIGVSAILKRKLAGASLTIFVKPAAGGSQVMIMTEGLSWDP